MDLKNKIRAFLNDTGATVTSFCKKIGISTVYYYKWMNDEVEYSDGLIRRIENYLSEVYAKA